MKPPSGSEQALSLKWALESVASFTAEAAVDATCSLFGFPSHDWAKIVQDITWYVDDKRWKNRHLIEQEWNRRFSSITHSWLDEDVWHSPIWRLWLPDDKMVFAANLQHLLKLKGRGSVAQLAKLTGRNITTASKWGRWQEEGRKVRIPPRTVEPLILEFFGLKPSCDLYREPLFLGRSEIHDELMRIEGRHYLDYLTGEHLSFAVDRLKEASLRQESASRS